MKVFITAFDYQYLTVSHFGKVRVYRRKEDCPDDVRAKISLGGLPTLSCRADEAITKKLYLE